MSRSGSQCSNSSYSRFEFFHTCTYLMSFSPLFFQRTFSLWLWLKGIERKEAGPGGELWALTWPCECTYVAIKLFEEKGKKKMWWICSLFCFNVVCWGGIDSAEPALSKDDPKEGLERYLVKRTFTKLTTRLEAHKYLIPYVFVCWSINSLLHWKNLCNQLR